MDERTIEFQNRIQQLYEPIALEPLEPAQTFEERSAIYSAAMTELRKIAITLNDFDLRVHLKWKKDPDKSMPPPDDIKIPELPRYVSDDVLKMVLREECRRTPRYKEIQATRAEYENNPPNWNHPWQSGDLVTRP